MMEFQNDLAQIFIKLQQGILKSFSANGHKQGNVSHSRIILLKGQGQSVLFGHFCVWSIFLSQVVGFEVNLVKMGILQGIIYFCVPCQQKHHPRPVHASYGHISNYVF